MLAVCVRLQYPDAAIMNVTDRYLGELKAEQIEGAWPLAARAFLQVFRFLNNVLRLPGPHLIPYGYLYLTLVAYFFNQDKLGTKRAYQSTSGTHACTAMIC